MSYKKGGGPLRVAWLKTVFWASGTEGNNLMRAPSDRSEIPLKYTLISFQLCALIGEDHQSRIIHKETYMLQISRDLSNKRLVQERTRPQIKYRMNDMQSTVQLCNIVPDVLLRLQYHHDQTLIKSEKSPSSHTCTIRKQMKLSLHKNCIRY